MKTLAFVHRKTAGGGKLGILDEGLPRREQRPASCSVVERATDNMLSIMRQGHAGHLAVMAPEHGQRPPVGKVPYSYCLIIGSRNHTLSVGCHRDTADLSRVPP